MDYIFKKFDDFILLKVEFKMILDDLNRFDFLF